MNVVNFSDGRPRGFVKAVESRHLDSMAARVQLAIPVMPPWAVHIINPSLCREKLTFSSCLPYQKGPTMLLCLSYRCLGNSLETALL